jgi:hypothetical protein
MSFSAEAISLYSINTWISPTAPERIFLFKMDIYTNALLSRLSFRQSTML